MGVHTRPTCASVCARARACDCAPTHPRHHVRAPSRRRGPRVARRAGVPLGVGVQREHRRVERRLSVEHGRGMRRLIGPGGAPPRAGRMLGTAARRNARMYVQDAHNYKLTYKYLGTLGGMYKTHINIHIYCYRICICICIYIFICI